MQGSCRYDKFSGFIIRGNLNKRNTYKLSVHMRCRRLWIPCTRMWMLSASNYPWPYVYVHICVLAVPCVCRKWRDASVHRCIEIRDSHRERVSGPIELADRQMWKYINIRISSRYPSSGRITRFIARRARTPSGLPVTVDHIAAVV